MTHTFASRYDNTLSGSARRTYSGPNHALRTMEMGLF
jgi:hypothetical protein